MRRPTAILLVAGIIVAAIGISISLTGARCTLVTGSDELRINSNGLASGHVRNFCYVDAAGRKIRFLLARGADGKVRSVFDACRECYVYHQGYALSGRDLVCRVCGNRYPIDRMTTGKLSCVPVALAHEESSGTIKIKVTDLKAGRPLF